MALPPIHPGSRGLRLALAPALLFAAAAIVTADGAVVSLDRDEPMPASRRLPAAGAEAPSAKRQAPSAPPAAKGPCPHAHKCPGAAPASRH